MEVEQSEPGTDSYLGPNCGPKLRTDYGIVVQRGADSDWGPFTSFAPFHFVLFLIQELTLQLKKFVQLDAEIGKSQRREWV